MGGLSKDWMVFNQKDPQKPLDGCLNANRYDWSHNIFFSEKKNIHEPTSFHIFLFGSLFHSYETNPYFDPWVHTLAGIWVSQHLAV